MSVTVEFPSGVTTVVPENHQVLESSVPLSMSLADGTLKIKEEWSVGKEQFLQYLAIDEIWNLSGLDIDDGRWKPIVNSCVTGMHVARRLCDEFTHNQCIDILYSVCDKLYVHFHSSMKEDNFCGHKFCFVLIHTILKTFHNDYINVIKDVLSQMPVELLFDLVEDRSNPMKTPWCWALTDFSPVFDGGVIFGIDLSLLFERSISNVVTKGLIDSVNTVICKYYNNNDPMSFEDAVTLASRDSYFPIFTGIYQGEIVKLMDNVQRCDWDFINLKNHSVQRILLTSQRASELLHDSPPFKSNREKDEWMRTGQVGGCLSRLIPHLHVRVDDLYFREDMTRRLFNAILADTHAYFIEDRPDIAEKYQPI